MKIKSCLLKQNNIKEAKRFYEELFHMNVSADFGNNIVFHEGLTIEKGDALEVKSSSYDAFKSELYFETDDFTGFLKRLKRFNVIIITPLFERNFGQRAIRFLDPSGHLLEVAETEECIAKRLKEEGYTLSNIAKKMHLLEETIEKLVS